MKKSGYRTTFHIYFIFLLTLIGTILSAILLFFLLITVRKPDGSYVRSDWPKSFTESFGRHIQFMDGTPRVTQAGIERCLSDHSRGAFGDLYASLNALDAEIRASDRLREETEKMREEWISNITHDLKTPLSPIKGYAEIIQDGDDGQEESYRRYAAVILKNAAYMEALIDDLKLTYQLENGLLPVNREHQNMVRFLKELAIDILNTPEYEDRVIGFDSTEDAIFYSFDPKLLTRAFRNLIINAFVHGGETAEVTLRVSRIDGTLLIQAADNGKGIGSEEAEHLFDRYYRGTSTGEKPEGTGLGLAIAKSIIELHGGTISAYGTPGAGTVFSIEFPVS